MRESLTILAIALIVVLTTALVGPYFVDWNAHRGAIEMRLSQLLGAKVTVAGPIDVKLLPRPIFRLGDVMVVGSAPRAAAASVERMDVELALTALLRGEFVFVDADLSNPRLTLVTGNDGAIVLPHFAATDPDHVSLDHVTFRKGSLLVVGEDGRPVITASGLSGDGEAESLVGPFRFAGQVDTPRGRVTFSLNTGAIDDGTIRLKATVDAGAGIPRTEAEGLLGLAADPTGASHPRFEGSATGAGVLPLAGSTAVVPWTLSGRIQAEPGSIAVTSLELRAGAEGRALVADGGGRIDGGPQPRAAFKLAGRQVDVPRLALAPGGGEGAPADLAATPKAADLLSALRSLVQNPDLSAGLPLPVTADLSLDAVTLGQLTLSDFRTHGVLTPGEPLAGKLSVAAPDGSRLALEGSFETGPAAVFKGRLEASTRDLGRLADSVAPDLPDQAALLRSALPARSVAFNGVSDLSAIGFAAHDVDLTLDGSRFAGTITLTRAVGADRARLFADVTSDALDLDALPDWRDAVTSAASFDLSISLTARAVRLAQSDTGSVRTGRVALELTKVGPAVTLDRLSLSDVGGATADLSGRSDGRTAHLEGRVDARRLKDLLALAQRLAPSRAGDQVLARADALSPALLTVAADAALDGTAAARLSRLAVDGTVAGTSVALHLTPAEAGFTASLKLDAPEAGALLRQLGIATLPSTAIGRGRVALDARLDGSLRPIDGGVAATLADTVLTLRGHGNDATGFSGRTTLKGGNVAPLLRAVSLAAPESGAVWPVEAAADVVAQADKVALSHLDGRMGGAAVKGDLAYVLPAPSTAATALRDAAGSVSPTLPALTGALAIDRLSLPELAGLALGPPAALRDGTVWPDAAFAPSLVNSLPRTDVALEIAAMPLMAALKAEAATMDLKLGPELVTVSGLSARLGGGRLGATVELRRNGQTASLNGHAAWSDLASATPGFGGRTTGALDLAGTGGSLAALVASLAGSGSIGVQDARLPRLDTGALARAVAGSADAATNSIDDTAIRDAVAADLDKGALALGAVSTPVTVAAGQLRADPVTVEVAGIRSTTAASLDLRSLLLNMTTTVTLPQPPKDWVGSAPAVTVSWSGPFTAPMREVNATALVNGLAARAIARDQERIEAFQDDIRERAFFARRLRAIEVEQQAARDKAKADQEAQLQKLLDSTAPATLAPLSNPPRPPVRPGPLPRPPSVLFPKASQPAP